VHKRGKYDNAFECSESIDDVLYKRVISMTVLCEFSDSIEFDTVQKRDKEFIVF